MSRRRSPQSVTSFRQSMVQVKIGNRTYDAVYQPTCRTCTHPARMLIEEKILQNYSFRQISELYSQKEIEGENGDPMLLPKITHQSIHTHFHNGHMPLEVATLRRLADRRATQIGAAYEESAERFADHVMLAEATISRVYERLATGEIEPNVRDGLRAAKFMADIESDTKAGMDSEAWSEAMMIYFDEAREVMDPAMWAEFTARLARNPVLRSLQRRLNPSNDVIDAEVIPTAIEGVS